MRTLARSSFDANCLTSGLSRYVWLILESRAPPILMMEKGSFSSSSSSSSSFSIHSSPLGASPPSPSSSLSDVVQLSAMQSSFKSRSSAMPDTCIRVLTCVRPPLLPSPSFFSFLACSLLLFPPGHTKVSASSSSPATSGTGSIQMREGRDCFHKVFDLLVQTRNSVLQLSQERRRAVQRPSLMERGKDGAPSREETLLHPNHGLRTMKLSLEEHELCGIHRTPSPDRHGGGRRRRRRSLLLDRLVELAGSSHPVQNLVAGGQV
mmetsp:Transcript_12079/g.42000  ORF Transcript_12079/g.42000 Transcript_12079/m.42000 type:complete len:264 (+) Transcript_12079:456-1247(+)